MDTEGSKKKKPKNPPRLIIQCKSTRGDLGLGFGPPSSKSDLAHRAHQGRPEPFWLSTEGPAQKLEPIETHSIHSCTIRSSDLQREAFQKRDKPCGPSAGSRRICPTRHLVARATGRRHHWPTGEGIRGHHSGPKTSCLLLLHCCNPLSFFSRSKSGHYMHSCGQDRPFCCTNYLEGVFNEK